MSGIRGVVLSALISIACAWITSVGQAMPSTSISAGIRRSRETSDGRRFFFTITVTTGSSVFLPPRWR